jgi:periplasmic copper chaperone A
MRFNLVPALVALLLLPLASAAAHQAKVGDLVIHHPWTRATPAGATVAAGYAEIENKGSKPDKLLSGSIEDASGFEIHTMSNENGVMSMRPVAGGVEIKPGQTMSFAPGGLHLMFPGLKKRLTEGDMVSGTLVFERAGKISLDFMVESLGGTPKEEGDEHASH